MDNDVDDILFEERHSIVFFVVCFAIALPLVAVMTYAGGGRHRLGIQFWDDPRIFLVASLAVLIGLAFSGMSGKVTVTPTHLIARTGRKKKEILRSDIIWAIIPRDYRVDRFSPRPHARYDAPTGPASVRVELQPALYFLVLFGRFVMKSVLLARRDGTYVLIPTKRPDELLKSIGASANPTF